MGNLYSGVLAQQNQGYVTNRFAPVLQPSGGQTQTLSAPSAPFANATAAAAVPENWAIHGVKILAAAPVDLADSLAANFPGVSRGQLDDATYDAIGRPDWGQFVRDNKEGISVASGIGGALATAAVTEFALGKVAAAALGSTSGVGRAVSSVFTMTGRAQAAAETEAARLALEGSSLGTFSGVNLRYVGTTLGGGLAKSATSELAIAAVMHHNDAVWSDDMSTNLLYAGIGLALGAGGSLIGARASIKRWANSDAVRNEFANAGDTAGFERMTTPTFTSGNPGTATIKPTSELTAYMLNARNDDTLAAHPAVNSRQSIKTAVDAKAQDMLQKISTRGAEGVENSKFGIQTTTEGAQLIHALHNDPAALYGAASVARIQFGVDKALTTRKALEDSLINSPSAVDKRKGFALQQQEPAVVLGGTLMTPSDAKLFDAVDPIVVPLKPTAAGVNELKWQAPSGKAYTIAEDGSLNSLGGQKPDWRTMPISDMQNTWDAMNQMTARLSRDPKFTLQLPANPHWSQIDYAVEAEKRGINVDWNKGALFQNSEDAQLASLQQKKAILNQAPLTVEQRLRLNLPMPTAVERVVDPLGDQLRLTINMSTNAGMDMAQLRKARLDAQRVTGLTSSVNGVDEMHGDMLNFNRAQSGTQAGKWMNPVLVHMNDVPAAKWSRWALADSIQENRAVRFSAMVKSRAAPLVQMLSNAIEQHPYFNTAGMISGLDDSQLSGAKNALKATASQFLTQDFRYRNVPALLGANAIRHVVNRLTEIHIDDVLKRMAPAHTEITSVGNQSSKMLFDQYASHVSGWDIGGEVVQPDGTTAFLLKEDSQMNRDRLGRDVTTGEKLTNQRTGNVIALDGVADNFRMALEKETKRLLANRNAVRTAFGLEPVKYRRNFIPPPRTTGKMVGFTLDGMNRVVPGYSVVADSEAEFLAKSDEIKALIANDPKLAGHKFMTRGEIEQHADLWDRTQIDFIDPTSMALPGKQARGGLTGPTINANSISDALHYLKSGYEQTANGVVRAHYEQALKISEIRDVAQQVEKGKNTVTKNIWATWRETMMGQPAGVNPRGLTGTMAQLDKWADAGIAAAWPALQMPGKLLSSITSLVPGYKPGPVKDFADLANQLGPHMPFKDAVDLANYQHGIKAPWTSRDAARRMNQLGAAVILRYLEIPQAAMNLSGIITNMPGLLSAKNVPILGRTNGVPVIDAMQIMAAGTKRMLMDRSGPDWDFMKQRGDTAHAVSEMNTQMNALSDQASWNKFMYGDASIQHSGNVFKTPKATLQATGLDRTLSYMTDTSESWSRQWAHFVGLELADHHGITGMEARHQFARQIANDAIANYDPLNRPEIYQNTLGSLYGLFLSYSQNYYQRMFKWAELGDNKAVAKSLGAQASMFGMAGVPGFQQLSELLGGEDTGTGLMDNIYKRFGPAVGNVVAHGGLSQVTTLLGLPPVALYTRGDNNFRNPASDIMVNRTLKLPIGVEVLKDVISGMWDVVSKLGDPNSLMTPKYAAQILARQMPNRALHGALTVLAADGQDQDVHGNIMAETQGWAESMYRMLGLRSSRQQGEIELRYDEVVAIEQSA